MLTVSGNFKSTSVERMGFRKFFYGDQWQHLLKKNESHVDILPLTIYSIVKWIWWQADLGSAENRRNDALTTMGGVAFSISNFSPRFLVRMFFRWRSGGVDAFLFDNGFVVFTIIGTAGGSQRWWCSSFWRWRCCTVHAEVTWSRQSASKRFLKKRKVNYCFVL